MNRTDWKKLYRQISQSVLRAEAAAPGKRRDRVGWAYPAEATALLSNRR
ncbi:hypothetical protein [Roseibium aggregatum]|nr:hypothetical protein [Roseibium aggregatum]